MQRILSRYFIMFFRLKYTAPYDGVCAWPLAYLSLYRQW